MDLLIIDPETFKDMYDGRVVQIEGMVVANHLVDLKPMIYLADSPEINAYIHCFFEYATDSEKPKLWDHQVLFLRGIVQFKEGSFTFEHCELD